MSASAADETIAAEPTIEPTLSRLYHLRRQRNSIASPLLRLPTELILHIFEYAIEPEGGSDNDDDDDSYIGDGDDDDISTWPKDGPTLVVLVSICHKLREIGITTPRLWGTVDLTIPSIAELSLKRCKYDPRIIIQSRYARRSQSIRRVQAVWAQLEGRAFNNLRNLAFKGNSPEFERRVVPILQTATKISSLDLENPTIPAPKLPWEPSAPLSHLSILRLRGFSISWTSHIIQNLTQLIVDLGLSGPPSEHAPMAPLLTALANCPDLELLKLRRAGPDPPIPHRDSRDAMVRLRKLRKLSLILGDPSSVGHILSHIKYPESARVKVHVPVGPRADIPEVVSQVFPCGDSDTLQYIQRSKALDVCWGDDTYSFSACDTTIRFACLRLGYPVELLQSTRKTLEVVGGGTVIQLCVTTWYELTDQIWGALLHGLPRLERIFYQRHGRERDQGFIDPFIFIFSRPFEGVPSICPQLQHLELPREVLTRDASVTLLKCALTERVACGRRLKRIGLSDDTVEGDERVLVQFCDLVEEIG